MGLTKLEKETAAEKKERLLLQEKIKKQFPDKLQSNREQLCSKCWAKDCFLIPVTSYGGDCPYFGSKPQQI